MKLKQDGINIIAAKRFYLEPLFYIYSSRTPDRSVYCEKIGENYDLLLV